MFQAVVDYTFAALDFSKDALVSTLESVQSLVSRSNSGAGLSPSLSVLVFVAAWAVWSRLRQRHAPPGPPRVPFLGNTFQFLLSRVAPCVLFEEWSKKYGEHTQSNKALYGI
jgi:hypothetical protein